MFKKKKKELDKHLVELWIREMGFINGFLLAHNIKAINMDSLLEYLETLK